MNDSKVEIPSRSTDAVLNEIWRIKDELSAACGHDLHRLFAEARERQKHSGHRIVNFQNEPKFPQE
jgi:hypothetical protein